VKIHRLLKWGLIAMGAFFFILAAIFVWALAYLIHKQHTYAVLKDTHDLNQQITIPLLSFYRITQSG